LENGFKFNDIDIILISTMKINAQNLKNQIEEFTGIKAHLILIDYKSLISGISSDPLYAMMLSRCISKKRLIFNVKRKINYKLLDLNLLKSKTLIDGFEILKGDEKYYLTMNIISILLFIEGKKLSREIVNKEIEKILDTKVIDIKSNIINKNNFISKYGQIYDKTFNLIMENIKHEE
jgi:hypothetical protein